MDEEKDPKEQVEALEDDPPQDLRDWPKGAAAHHTLGGREGDHSYDEGPERNLGPSELERHEDGSITIEGEPVDNPEEHKADPIRLAAERPDDEPA